MALEQITIKGARTHNLKNIDLVLPRDRLIVFTGLSGSGKSSLAFDTLYAEGQRRYVESLSAYARQFLSLMEKPDVDHIEGLSPAISIEQKSTSHNPRSTVGTITEIYDYVRLLFARVGEPRCPEHNIPLQAQTVSQIVDKVLSLPEGTKMMLLSPMVDNRKGEYLSLFDQLNKQGYTRVRLNGEVMDLADVPKLDRHKKHTIEVIVDRFKVKADIQSRLADSVETALGLSEGIVRFAFMDNTDQEELIFSEHYACVHCGFSIEELEPRTFSFNSPKGACTSCDGIGQTSHFDEARIVHDPSLSLSQGAIRNWNKNNLYYYNQLLSLSEHYEFDMDTPYHELPEEVRNVLMQGSAKERIAFKHINSRGVESVRKKPFEGLIPQYQRRYQETDSNIIREELNKLMTSQDCPDCEGSRLCVEARHVFINETRIVNVMTMSIEDVLNHFSALTLKGQKANIAEKILKEICARLKFLVDVGLNYLTLSRRADTLSGGEAQRIRLASQIGAGLVGVMYILDEPSIGLHQRDNERLINTLKYLKELGNTVIVVEHDEDAILAADHIVDIGPGAGKEGGAIMFEGNPEALKASDTLTGRYLSGRECIAIPMRHPSKNDYLSVVGATGNNLKKVSIDIPVGLLTCITGVSGSGKSTLINQTLYPAAARALNGAESMVPAPHEAIRGLHFFDKVIDINQSPIGRTPRSNPATYTGLFTLIRDLFTQTEDARTRGYSPGRFSFNVKGGRCEACQGDGVIKVEMHFLSDVYVTCDQCKGKRYNRETLEVKYKGKNIYEVLEMPVAEALEFFDAIPAIKRKLQTLMDVGLSYIQLGQRATTLSGGEAQRIKLAKELARRDTGTTLYILDEPTTGLHFHDINQLLKVLHALRDRGNTVVIIEHNLDVIKTADWLIDLGPEGGDLGGTIMAEGTPEQVAKVAASHTGCFLKHILEKCLNAEMADE